jgi:hypothetical protein
MNDSLVTAVRHDVQQLVDDLAAWLTLEHGGTRAHNRELAADYLIDTLHVAEQDTVTGDLLSGVARYAAAEIG